MLAVDLPRSTSRCSRFLRDWPGAPTVVPEVDGRLQPVCARYGADAFARRREPAWSAGMRSLHALLDVVEHDVVRRGASGRVVAGADAFADVDTPDDAARLGIALAGVSVPPVR